MIQQLLASLTRQENIARQNSNNNLFMKIADFITGVGTNTNKVDHAIAADSAAPGSVLEKAITAIKIINFTGTSSYLDYLKNNYSSFQIMTFIAGTMNCNGSDWSYWGFKADSQYGTFMLMQYGSSHPTVRVVQVFNSTWSETAIL